MRKWNGSGMASLTPERRSEIATRESHRRKKQASGWPENVQNKRWDREALEACTWAWAKLMAKSERAHWT